MAEEKKKINVGLVMPIALIDGCGPEHWLEVKSIISDALANHDQYEFEARLVSESDSSGLIHKRIVQGLYNSDLVICDVSCKNPNVMFELGMRLAFDKPTIIIKDDKTNYTFDAGGIEHLDYPRDLRFSKVVDFKNTLLRKTVATFEDSLKDPNHSPFLKSFGQFKVAKLNETEVMPIELIMGKLNEMQSDFATLKFSQSKIRNTEIHQIPSLRTVPKDDLYYYLENQVNNYLSSFERGIQFNQDELIADIILQLRRDNPDLVSDKSIGSLRSRLKDILNRIVFTA
ncbi:hypothetical protein [Brevibacillus reuszeri]|uniref:hypothetical protein n=1 Tax=Brevibacillus reuszeri TaxID=54915 RepID=UPI000CCC5858|nr:hypothetical protein [Brevibacillus reuszeri]